MQSFVPQFPPPNFASSLNNNCNLDLKKLPNPFSESVLYESSFSNPFQNNNGGRADLNGLFPTSTSRHLAQKNQNTKMRYGNNDAKRSYVARKPKIWTNTNQNFYNGAPRIKFYCETCDRNFNCEAKYKEHCTQHIKCGRDGCNFLGHPKIVELHRRLQHDTGFAKRILKSDDPDEIKKWREERKKNYPTAQNILKKKEEEDEKKKSGNVLPVKQFGKMNKGNGMHKKFNQNNEKFKKKQKFKKKFQKNRRRYIDRDNPLVEEIQRYTGNNNNNDRPSKSNGIFGAKIVNAQNKQHNSELEEGEYISEDDVPEECANIKPAECISDSDNEDAKVPTKNSQTKINELPSKNPNQMDTTENGKKKNPELLIRGALGSLICNYGSDSEDNQDDEKQVPSEKNKNEEPSKVRAYNDNRSKLNNNFKLKPNLRKYHTSLLEKLLAKEIQRERNTVLQCIRHIVKNIFFEKND